MIVDDDDDDDVHDDDDDRKVLECSRDIFDCCTFLLYLYLFDQTSPSSPGQAAAKAKGKRSKGSKAGKEIKTGFGPVVQPGSGFQCVCGSSTCPPPQTTDCSDPACGSAPNGNPRYSRTGVWIADCSTSDAHKTIYFAGSWVGKGCRRGLVKASGGKTS